jgi:hypothetical protein
MFNISGMNGLEYGRNSTSFKRSQMGREELFVDVTGRRTEVAMSSFSTSSLQRHLSSFLVRSKCTYYLL